jgi:DNA-binding transcriptional regulator YiaG
MSSFAAAIKNEVVRLARREIKAAVGPMRKQLSAQRSAIAELKRRVAELEQRTKRIARVSKSAVRAGDASPESASSARFSAKGLKSLRGRLGLSAADFGTLAGVSGQSVYNWEAGKTRPQRAQLEAIQALRSIGKREAAARLEAAA